MLESIVARTTEAGSRTLVAATVAGEESCGGYMAGVSFSFLQCQMSILNSPELDT